MTTTKHTPGPWEVAPNARGIERLVVEGGGIDCLVAECEREEDARLIAAAPELLEAARTLLAKTRKHDGSLLCDCSRCESTLKLARAVAKATGSAS